MLTSLFGDLGPPRDPAKKPRSDAEGPDEGFAATAILESMDTSVNELSELMTENRVRHIPVVVDGRLAGIVSIGDVVKTRLEELKAEQEQLQAYITQG